MVDSAIHLLNNLGLLYSNAVSHITLICLYRVLSNASHSNHIYKTTEICGHFIYKDKCPFINVSKSGESCSSQMSHESRQISQVIRVNY